MAEGWGRFFHGEWLDCFSAGTEPKGIDPKAVQVMQEAGVDMTSQHSESLDEYVHKRFDVVITLCGDAQEHCPVFPARTLQVHHGFDDPPRCVKEHAGDEEMLCQFRRVRDEIKEYVKGFSEEMFRKNRV